jgi:hypothetical protein
MDYRQNKYADLSRRNQMKAEGVTEINPVLADAIGLRRENFPQNNSFSANTRTRN